MDETHDDRHEGRHGAGAGPDRGASPRDSCSGRGRRHRHRKARVLHTRISEPLAEDIRKIAEELRVPVSNLVRNVLEEAFSVVETVTGNVGDLIEDVVDEAERARERIWRQHRRSRRGHFGGGRHARRWRSDEESPDDAAPVAPERAEYPEVLGWQPLILNAAQSCADCEESLERGERAFAGVAAAGLTSRFLCRDCMDARR
jgi:hypothetical protein